MILVEPGCNTSTVNEPSPGTVASKFKNPNPFGEFAPIDELLENVRKVTLPDAGNASPILNASIYQPWSSGLTGGSETSFFSRTNLRRTYSPS